MTLTLLNHRYQVLRVLGSGGFGETFLAEDTQMPSSRHCVIKQLKPVANNPQIYQLVKERFQQEAAILEDLGDRSEQIPRLYAYFVDNGEFYLVQEYVEGLTLTQKIQQQGLQSESAVKDILINILPVLEYVHNKRIVHRDIKPDNIILRFSDGKPVLIDFGAVKVTMGTVMTASGNSNQSIVIGTPGFMPMEQSVGRPVFSSDLYSLGLTAIYLLTGKLPQEFTTDPATGDFLWRNHVGNISPSFAQVLDKAIQQSPRDRYLTVRDMLAALQTPATPVAPTVPVYQQPYTPVAPTVPYQQPTPTPQPTPVYQQPPIPIPQPPTPVPSSPPIYQQPPTPIPPSTPIPSHSQVTPTNGLGTWQQAVIIGGVIGSFLVGGVWVMGFMGVINSPTQPTPEPKAETVLQPKVTPEPQPTVTQPVIQQPTSPPIQQSTNPISRTAAIEAVQNWLGTKPQLFGSSYNTEVGEQLLTGIAYRENIKKTDNADACLASGTKEDDCLSSLEWLQRNNSYYLYDETQIVSIEDFYVRGDNQATIKVAVREKISFYNNGKLKENPAATRTSRYDLQYENNQVKISFYCVYKESVCRPFGNQDLVEKYRYLINQ
ncbi:MAG: DUF4101 domain-containing protein [Goleter apudmare HA4340-LM2]|jgi:serine/threonine-protein kinase|nr:DUF4101 domain-containing protein [Goleter apudmare HA4340-LM2]